MEALLSTGLNLVHSVPQDIGSFSSSYAGWNDQQRAQFWTFLISGVAEFESDFDPNETYTENFNDSHGHPVVSTGLLQISFESANQAAYGCNLADPHELFDPLINLTCGVRIMQALVTHDGAISRINGSKIFGAARYWSTLRPNHQRNPLENIQHWCRQLAV